MANESILIVEDERIVADNLALTLKDMGYTILGIEGTGEGAVKAAARVCPDLILMDIYLAGTMTGIDAAEAIVRRQDVAIIFLTAFADDQIVEKAKQVGAYGYLLKPYDDPELRSAIEIALFKSSLDRKLQESEEKYRGFVQNFLGIAFRSVPDQTPIFLHGAVESMTGYTELEFLAGSPRWESIVNPDDRQGLRRKIQELTDGTEDSAICDYRIIRKDGTERWISENVRFVPPSGKSRGYLQGARYDITDRKQAESDLRRLNEELEERVRARTRSLADQLQFLQQLIDTIPSPVFYQDMTGRYLGCNNAFEAYLGQPRTTIIGKTDSILNPGDPTWHENEKDLILIRNGGIQVFYAKCLHADRSLRDVIFKRASFNNADGTIAGIVGVMLDITEQVRAAEDELGNEEEFAGAGPGQERTDPQVPP